MIHGYVLIPHDVPPIKVSPPQTFENTDLYPAVTIKASRKEIAEFSNLVERSDDLGVCLVGHFKVMSTLVIFYQSAFDIDEDRWTIFVDINGCVVNGQPPTLLGKAVVRILTAGSIEPEWVNVDADKVYRSRRRKPSKVSAPASEPQAKRTNKSVMESKGRTRMFDKVPNDLPMVVPKGIGAGSGRHAIAKKNSTAKTSAEKRNSASGRKTGTAKKATTSKKADSSKK